MPAPLARERFLIVREVAVREHGPEDHRDRDPDRAASFRRRNRSGRRLIGRRPLRGPSSVRSSIRSGNRCEHPAWVLGLGVNAIDLLRLPRAISGRRPNPR
jgi:hypothetical protein